MVEISTIVLNQHTEILTIKTENCRHPNALIALRNAHSPHLQPPIISDVTDKTHNINSPLQLISHPPTV